MWPRVPSMSVTGLYSREGNRETEFCLALLLLSLVLPEHLPFLKPLCCTMRVSELGVPLFQLEYVYFFMCMFGCLLNSPMRGIYTKEDMTLHFQWNFVWIRWPESHLRESWLILDCPFKERIDAIASEGSSWLGVLWNAPFLAWKRYPCVTCPVCLVLIMVFF